MTIDIQKELDAANSRLPVKLPDDPLPMEMQVRSIAVTIAAKFVGETTVTEGGLYQQLKMDNKLGDTVSISDVIKASLVIERYIWGEWSKGIAEHALNSTATDFADAIERELDARKENIDDEPIRGSAA